MRSEGVDEVVGGAGREGGARGKTVAGGETHQGPGAQRKEGGDRGKMVSCWRGKETAFWSVLTKSIRYTGALRLSFVYMQ